jgi:hypothetical protein
MWHDLARPARPHKEDFLDGLVGSLGLVMCQVRREGPGEGAVGPPPGSLLLLFDSFEVCFLILLKSAFGFWLWELNIKKGGGPCEPSKRLLLFLAILRLRDRRDIPEEDRLAHPLCCIHGLLGALAGPIP